MRTNRFLLSEGQENLLFYGANFNLFYKNVKASFSYRNNFSKEELVSTKSLIDLTASYAYNDYCFKLKAGIYRSPNLYNREDDVFLNFVFSKRFGIPLKKNKEYSKAILSIETFNAKLNTPITMQVNGVEYKPSISGEYIINNIPAPEILIDVVPNTIPQGYIIAEKLPMILSVQSNQNNRQVLNLVKSSEINGIINFDTDRFNAGINKENYAFYLKLSSNDEVYFSESRNGKYKFDGVKPGTYTLEVLNKDFESNFKENKVLKSNIIILPGVFKEFDFSLIKSKRKIIFK